MKVDTLNRHRSAMAQIASVARHIDSLSEAFFETGNDKMSRQLAAMHKGLVEGLQEAEIAINMAVDEHIADANQASHNMVLAAFAVAEKLYPQAEEASR